MQGFKSFATAPLCLPFNFSCEKKPFFSTPHLTSTQSLPPPGLKTPSSFFILIAGHEYATQPRKGEEFTQQWFGFWSLPHREPYSIYRPLSIQLIPSYWFVSLCHALTKGRTALGNNSLQPPLCSILYLADAFQSNASSTTFSGLLQCSASPTGDIIILSHIPGPEL